MHTYQIQEIISQLIGEEVDIFDAIETYYEIVGDESPLYWGLFIVAKK